MTEQMEDRENREDVWTAEEAVEETEEVWIAEEAAEETDCLLYTSPSPRDN